MYVPEPAPHSTKQSARNAVEALSSVPGYEGSRLVGDPRPLQGGFWAEIAVLTVDVAGRREHIVWRRMPDRALALKEAAFQSAVSTAGFPAPSLLLLREDESSGVPEVLMELAPGRPPLSGLGGPSALVQFPRLARRLPTVLATAMSDLHALDTKLVEDRLAEFGGSAPFDMAGVLDSQADAARALERDELAQVVGKLVEEAPPEAPPSVCHGDLHPFNLVVERDRWCLLDWTAAVLAPPAYDLAFTGLLLRHPPLHSPRTLAPIVGLAASAVARRFMREYAARAETGLPDPDVLSYFEAVHSVRILLEIEQRRRSGTAGDRGGHPWLVVAPEAARILQKWSGRRIRYAS